MKNKMFDCCGLFDSHAHYFDKRFAEETDGADAVLERDVFASGVEGVINIGTNSVTNRLCIEQAKKHKKMFVAVGIHPEDISCEENIQSDIQDLYTLVGDINSRRKNKIVAIGEIGLDYHYEGFEKELQKKYFENQLKLARELDLPVIIHDRDAHGDCFEAVIKYSNIKGVFHSFSGSAEMAKELVKRGWYISFSGVLTFKNARKTVEAAEGIPMDKILIETDCPYLAPHPFRGKINHSGLIYLTAQRLAEIKNISVEDVVRETRNNVFNLFGI